MDELWKLESVELSESRQFVSKVSERLKTTRDPVLLAELVEFYFKNGSKRARKVLTSLREIHSQDYFDKLHESIQRTSTRLPVLKLLAHTLNSETSWLYRVVDHPLFVAILEQLKMSVDIVVLCSGVFVVTAILPLVPSYVGAYLEQLFIIFCSLATIRETKRLGLTPKELCLNLDVAVYYFFLQLYALFPNNLVQHLKQFCARPGGRDSFDQSIAPLFYQVQLHPSLVVGGVSYELSRQKWGNMEPDDIATLSLRLCLDHHLATGTNDKHTHTSLTEPHTSQATLSADNTLHPPPINSLATGPSNHIVLSELPEPTGLKTSEELAQFWSPLEQLGPVTPHHSSNISPNDSNRSSVHLYPGTSLHQSNMSSPVSDSVMSSTLPTPRPVASNLFTFSKNYSPTASIDSDSGRQLLSKSVVQTPHEEPQAIAPLDPLSQSLRVEGMAHQKRGQPRKSFREKVVGRFIGLFVPRSTKHEESNSTKEEFTELFATDLLPHHHSIAPSVPLSETNGPIGHGPLSEASHDEVGVECLPDSLKNSNIENKSTDTTNLQSEDSSTKPQSIPCSSCISCSNSQSSDETKNCLHHPLSLDRVWDSGECPPERNEDVLHPYSFSYPERGPSDGLPRRVRSSHSECSTQHTVMLLKERLQELVEGGKQYKLASGDSSVAVSTPIDSEPIPFTSNTNPEFSTESIVTVLPVTPPPSGPLTLSHNLKNSPLKPGAETIQPSSSLPAPGSNSANSLGVGLANRLLVKRVSVSSRLHNQFSDSSIESSGSEPMALPTPHPSPAELLDQYISRGVILHRGQFETIPLTELEGVDWTHFGGCPHSEEFGMMQSQAVLLHSQLMFERYQCSQHARRNRTLLSQARTGAKVAEELQSLREQLHHQTMAMNSLQSELRQKVLAHNSLLKIQESLRTRNQQLVADSKQLRDTNIRLKEEIHGLTERNSQMQQKLDRSNDKVASLEQDHSHLASRLEWAESLQKEVDILSRELQVLGDRYQQSRQEVLSARSHFPQGVERLCTALRREKDTAEKSGMALKRELGVASARVTELEGVVEQLKRTEQTLKRQLDTAEGRWQSRIAALEDKYRSMKSVSLQLESQVLELQGAAPLVKRKRHKRSISQPTETRPLTSSHQHIPHKTHTH